jgi:hypothetical protein
MTTTIYISISLLYIIITKIRYSLRNLIRRNYDNGNESTQIKNIKGVFSGVFQVFFNCFLKCFSSVFQVLL